jgi:hypothetical protein
VSVAFIDTKAHPSADNYFAMFPNEPVLDTGSINIGAIRKLPKMTVTDLLQSIENHARNSADILIVCHGTDMGPSLPLSPRNQEVYLQQNALNALRKYGDGRSTLSNAASLMMMSEAAFTRFWQAVQDVRALALNRVEFRSCTVGANNDTLNLLRWFFGSRILGAPKNLDTYGWIDPGRPTGNATTWTNWLDKFKNAKQFGSPPNRFAIHLEIDSGVKLNAISESSQAVKDWIKTHLPTGGTYRSGKFPVHGVINNEVTDIIWAGEPGYRGYLRKVGP